MAGVALERGRDRGECALVCRQLAALRVGCAAADEAGDRFAAVCLQVGALWPCTESREHGRRRPERREVASSRGRDCELCERDAARALHRVRAREGSHGGEH